MRKARLGDLCCITSSKRCHMSERDEVGVPFYQSKEILQLDKGEEPNDCDYIAIDLYQEIKEKFGAPIAGDVLLTSRGTIGTPYLYTDDDNFYFADGNLSWFKDFSSEINSEWFYYWLKSTEGFAKVNSCAKGTAQKAVSLELLRELEINLPDVQIQQQTADVLSSYDSLIENNRKQIKLLEEAAQRLYKEWFIDFRFSGHETAEIDPETCLPEGWKRCQAIDVFPDITIGKTPSRERVECFTKHGIPWFSVSDLGNEGLFATNSSESLVPDAVNEFNVKKVPSGSILLSFKLTIGRCSINTIEATTNEAIAHFKPHNDSLRYYTYLYLKSFPYETLGSTSSISQAINSRIVKTLPFVLPAQNIMDTFSYIVSPIFHAVLNARQRMDKAREARDRLLSKLMEGEND